MLKAILTVLMFAALIFSAYAQDLTVNLVFPKSSRGPVTGVKKIEPPVEVSGTLILDVNPYPTAVEDSRYSAQYFLNDELVYETNGYDAATPGRLDFKYALDTTKYDNGSYRLFVNFWDNKGPSAIGTKDIIITQPAQ